MNLVKKFLTKKIIFKKIYPIDILLTDDQFANLKFKNIKYHYYNPNNYYFFELVQSFYIFVKKLFKKKLSIIYFEIFLKSSKPKLVIGNEMSKNIFICKDIIPQIKTICYQFAFMFDEDINFFYKKNLNKKIADYFFAYDKRSIHILKRLIKSNYLINGSTKTNEKLICKPKNGKDITYISRFKPLSHIKDKETLAFTKAYRSYDKFFLRILEKFCLNKKLRLNIAFMSNRKDKKKYNFYGEEFKYYNSLIKNFFIAKNNFKCAFNSKLVISSTSNLGYELLFAGKKVLFLDGKRKKYQFKFFKNDIGPCWYYGKDEKKISDYINSNYYLKEKIWLKKFFATNKSFRDFHQNINLYKKNIFFKKKIREILKDNK